MKPTKNQKELCKLVRNQASFWSNTNDIYSPTHYNDIEEEVNEIDFLCEDAKEQFIDALSTLYHLIKMYN